MDGGPVGDPPLARVAAEPVDEPPVDERPGTEVDLTDGGGPRDGPPVR
ncbi:hypothetical protein [Streptomyces sp. B3I8]|nr:hypothetical protein [Streptomyces sp. B3I8]MDQ0788098.1 hypothetical protein [Streptomyces sp. B3I8]